MSRLLGFHLFTSSKSKKSAKKEDADNAEIPKESSRRPPDPHQKTRRRGIPSAAAPIHGGSTKKPQMSCIDTVRDVHAGARPSRHRGTSLRPEDSKRESELGQAKHTEIVYPDKGKDIEQGTKKASKDMKVVKADEVFTNHESLPSMQKAYRQFIRVYQEYLKTVVVDEIRAREYAHLDESGHVCLDYTGYGLFSTWQQKWQKVSTSFGLSYISANLPTHALYGGADEGTVEDDLKQRVSQFLNIQESEYAMVFTTSRGSAFKLLAESYPFHLKKRLLTVYDYESEAVTWMEEAARKKGAEVVSSSFRWPSQRLWATDLKKKILDKKKKGSPGKGLFVFPVQSRVTGTKYSYQWMPQAQENGWDILLDASALGPKIMGSLGLSVFRPDFIVSSFFKVYDSDPTGFGCLLIKRSAIQGLHSSSTARAVGMVKLVPAPVQGEQGDGERVLENFDSIQEEGNDIPSTSYSGSREMCSVPSFSGPISQYYRAQGHVMHAPINTTRSACDLHSSTSVSNDLEREQLESPSTSGTSPYHCASLGELSPCRLEQKKFRSRSLDQIVEDYTLEDDSDVSETDSSNIREVSQSESMHSNQEIDSTRAQWINSRSRLSTFSLGQDDSETSSVRDSEHFSEKERHDWHDKPSLAVNELGSQEDSYYLYSESDFADEDDASFVSEVVDDASVEPRKEPEIVCRGLDHADTLGLTRTNIRVRCLINWVVASMLKLHHPGHPDSNSLVQIYGPKVSYDRGASVAFNLFDWRGNLIQPDLVQRLADRSNISLGVATLQHMRLPDNHKDWQGHVEPSRGSSSGSSSVGEGQERGKFPSIKVVMAALGFISNFEDVYRFWAFLAKFLDADFVSKEVWRYRSLNQQTVVLGMLEPSRSSLH